MILHDVVKRSTILAFWRFATTEVVAQLGIEPVTTRCLVAALATKLLGPL